MTRRKQPINKDDGWVVLIYARINLFMCLCNIIIQNWEDRIITKNTIGFNRATWYIEFSQYKLLSVVVTENTGTLTIILRIRTIKMWHFALLLYSCAYSILYLRLRGRNIVHWKITVRCYKRRTSHNCVLSIVCFYFTVARQIFKIVVMFVGKGKGFSLFTILCTKTILDLLDVPYWLKIHWVD